MMLQPSQWEHQYFLFRSLLRQGDRPDAVHSVSFHHTQPSLTCCLLLCGIQETALVMMFEYVRRKYLDAAVRALGFGFGGLGRLTNVHDRVLISMARYCRLEWPSARLWRAIC